MPTMDNLTAVTYDVTAKDSPNIVSELLFKSYSGLGKKIKY